MNTKTLRRVGLAGATAVLLVASFAHAAPSSSRTIDVEITDSNGSTNGTKETMHFNLALDGSNSTKVSMAAGDFSYRIEARSDGSNGSAVPVGLKLNRSDHRSGSPGRIDVDLNAAVPLGNRVVVATAARPDGTRIEIALRAH